MSGNTRDTFSSRLHEQPTDAHTTYYRVPKFKDRMRHVWEPLFALNRAQAITLAECDLLDAATARDILDALTTLEEQTDPTEFDAHDEFEGPYFFIENHLIDELGENIGGKLHTGRSRNDLYATAFRMATRKHLHELMDAILDLRAVLLEKAENTTDVVFPAFTHSQPAQPITFAHYLLAVEHVLSRDFDRFKRAYHRTNQCPLGAAAIGGTGFSLDRDRLSNLCGFEAPIENTYDAIASVDYAPEAASALALHATNISRVSQDFLTWSMFEVGFIELSEGLSNVSSIMPQKKNPGVLEKTRAGAGAYIGTATSALSTVKAVPFGDVGETTASTVALLDAATDAEALIRLFAAIIEDITIHEDRMYEDAVESFCTMTELADTFVRKTELSFREAHEIVGYLTHQVYRDGRHAGEITVADVNDASEAMVGKQDLVTADDLEKALDPSWNVTQRDIAGGTAPAETKKDLSRQQSRHEADDAWLAERAAALEAARDERRSVRPT